MAILLSCPCGKQLRVNDEFAGRRVKCPECQNVIAVPTNGQGNAFTAAPASKTGAKAGGVVRFACGCGKQMQARSEFAGKQTKCPGCGSVVLIPGSNEESVDFVEKGKFSSGPVPSGKRRQEDDDRDEKWDEDEDRPRKRKGAPGKSKRAMWPWVAGIAAVVLLVGGGLAWFFLFRGANKMTADLAMVPRDATGFLSVRVSDWLKTDSGKEFEKALGQIPDISKLESKFGMKVSDIDRVTVVFPTENPNDAWAIVSASKPLDEKKILAEIPNAKETKVQGKSYHSSPQGEAIHFASSNVLVTGKAPGVQRFLEKTPSSSGPLSDGLELAADTKYHVVGGFQVPPMIRQRMKASMGAGRGMGMGPDFTPFAELQSGTVTAILGQETQIDLRLTFPDAAKAANAKKIAEQLLSLAKLFMPAAKAQISQAAGAQAAQALQMFAHVEQAVNSLKINQEGATLHIPVNLKVNLGTATATLLLPAIQKVRTAATRTQSANNIRQLGLAFHNYHGTYKVLPTAAIYSPDGKPLLSWRVAILPFIEQENLYQQFHLNEPWDSPHNIKLLPLMPRTFAPPPGVQTAKPHSTFFQVFTGPNTPFNGRIPARIPTTFQDGMSNTFMVVEAGDAVQWTKPDDLPYDPGKPLPRLGGAIAGGFNAALADGSVIWIDRARVNDTTIRALITPAGNEVLPPNWAGR